jgi:hypothetical protein
MTTWFLMASSHPKHLIGNPKSFHKIRIATQSISIEHPNYSPKIQIRTLLKSLFGVPTRVSIPLI